MLFEFLKSSFEGKSLFKAAITDIKEFIFPLHKRMKRKTAYLIIGIILMNFAPLFAEEKNEDPPFRLSESQNLTLNSQIYNSAFFSLGDRKSDPYLHQSNTNLTFALDKSFPERTNPIERFSIVPKKEFAFSQQKTSDIPSSSKNKKKYSKAALEITASNVLLWAFDHYVRDKSWAKISFQTVIENFKTGPAWDLDDIITNHFAHPYHGAIHFSMARANRLDFAESMGWAFLGSFMWEFFLESRGAFNNPPSLNDLITNTFGGAALGEVMFRIANLVIDESSVGIERAIRELCAFLIDPAFGLRAVYGDAFRRGNPPETYYYSLEFPVGVYSLPDNKTSFFLSANLEYKDYIKPNLVKIKPYDWFLFDFRLGFHEYDSHNMDFEIYTTGILTGKKIKNGLIGLFGIFDYINNTFMDRIGAVGLGPGFMTSSPSESDYFFSSFGVLSFIAGATTPSFEIEDYHFGRKFNDPYYFGPGLLGRINFEFGKRGLGSIHTGYSQFWVHSIFTSATEYQGILSLNIDFHISGRSEIRLGYDYYLRYASYQNEKFSGTTPSFRALYILKF